MKRADNSNEFERLRKDFEANASQYPDLKLSVYIIDSEKPTESVTFIKPNHKISLWQYMGELASDADIERIASATATKFGVSNAIKSAFAVIEGHETELFTRMAMRAGSLVPSSFLVQMQDLLAKKYIEPASGKPVFVENSNPVARWLNLVLIAIATYQPNRFKQATLCVDPFAASLAVFDWILEARPQNSPDKASQTKAATLEARQFEIALSFPGEKRSYVSAVAEALKSSGSNVFYDKDFEPELARPNLDLLLQRIYHDNSQLIVVFICAEYESKEWCGLEWRAIRDLLKKGRNEDIMILRFDTDETSGLFSIDGYVDVSDRPPAEAAKMILQRFRSRD